MEADSIKSKHMSRRPKYLNFKRKIILTFFLIISTTIAGWAIFKVKAQKINENSAQFPSPEILENKLAIIEENSLLSLSRHFNSEPQVIRKIKVIVTGYSSTVDQTDSDPFVTAAGTLVREGMVANNGLPFGTKIKIPELYGDKIFVVEDRMNWKKGKYHVDVWFASYWEAKNFGAQRTYIEVLEG